MKNVRISWKMALPLVAILLSSVFTSCSDDEKKLSDLTGFLSFGFSDAALENYEFTIGSDNVITNQIALPYGFDASALTPVFSAAPLSTVNIAGIDQVSGSVAMDFTSDIVFSVVAENGDNTLNYTVRVNVATTLSAWTNLSPNAGFPLYTDITAFDLDGKYFVVGGLKGASVYGDHEAGIYSSTDGSDFVEVTSAIFQDYGMAVGTAAVKHGDKQLLVGGMSYSDYFGGGTGDGSASNKVWSSTDGTTWEKVTTTENPYEGWGAAPEVNSFTARTNATVANMNGDLYLTGGFSVAFGAPQGAMADVWKSTDGGATWTNLEADFGVDFVARAKSQLVVYNDELYLIGGRESNNSSVLNNEIYKSTDGVTWTKLAVETPFTACSGHICYEYNDRFYLIGGNKTEVEVVAEEEVTKLVPMNDVWVSEDAGVNWTKVTEGALPEGFAARAGHAFVKDANTVHIFGGMGAEADGTAKVLTDSWKGTLN
ncbi:exo-alpha-sialidase [Ancylomarina euxinus]|uniref:Exo-alpha-sialidase n=1 Tax=Ancylomarina euxinus TaxID=2283627 RepID=A0A425XZT4_9BACT|nr:DUF6242 domain-containing protein [Ancylomarina euxinus]MCZ4695402.1 DUF6242 domain-containing protein [Ancylomarina euxinus]MUP15598.1 hypothetical protein [Ancylomarina euxinus]RRG20961.1 exo-alpha-sialidase [Ancylomarina euxinus]